MRRTGLVGAAWDAARRCPAARGLRLGRPRGPGLKSRSDATKPACAGWGRSSAPVRAGRLPVRSGGACSVRPGTQSRALGGRAAVPAALLTLLLAGLTPAPAQPARAPAPPIDPTRDARLAQRVQLRAEAIPVSWVLRRLSEVTGVGLETAGATGDERLVAFVPDAPLSEALLAVADLYRLSWMRTGSAERPKYRLYKTDRAAREEQVLRDRALRELVDRMLATLRNPGAPENSASWVPVYPHLFPLVASRRDELLREGYLSLRVGELPLSRREPLLAAMRPILRARRAPEQGEAGADRAAGA